MEEENTLSRKSAQVPGQYGGYSLQATRFLYRLLHASSGDVISLEVFDDVGVETLDGVKTAEQSKITLNGNPISNRAKDLWKTLSNWIIAIQSGQLESSKTFFEIYVSKKVSGKIADSFSQAKTDDEAKTALLQARQLLWGDEPLYPEKVKLADTIKDYVNHVFETDENIVCSIIKNFSLTCGSGSPTEDVEDLIKKYFISDANISNVILHSLGWVKRETDILIEHGKPASIKQDDFHKEMTAFVIKVDRQLILESYAPDPTEKQIKTDLGFRTYVKQLEVIDADYEDKLSAVKDYLLASSDRTAWGDQGLVHESSFDDFEDDLKRTWKNNKRASDLEFRAEEDLLKGKLLYSKCSSHTNKLQGMETPNHFTSGSFHALSDEKIIGWHPNYDKKLESFNNQDDTE